MQYTLHFLRSQTLVNIVFRNFMEKLRWISKPQPQHYHREKQASFFVFLHTRFKPFKNLYYFVDILRDGFVLVYQDENIQRGFMVMRSRCASYITASTTPTASNPLKLMLTSPPSGLSSQHRNYCICRELERATANIAPVVLRIELQIYR